MHDATNGFIEVRDAHLHNLKHVDVRIPRGQLVAVTGISGSGKSSLAFGTIHGEAQRRYFESVGPFARRLIAGATDPQVEAVEGLPPSVALEQNRAQPNARSTVGTVSSMSNLVRLLFSRAGDYPKSQEHLDAECFSPNTTSGMCPTCQGTGVVHEPTEASMVPDPSKSIDEGAIEAWPGAWAGKNFHDILATLGVDMHSPWRDLPRETREWILYTEERPIVTVHPVRSAEQVEKTYQGQWRSVASYLNHTLATTESDTLRARTLRFMETHRCPTCDGRRLNQAALTITFRGVPMDEFNALELSRIDDLLGEPRSEAERLLIGQLRPILTSAVELGLGHLTLDRASSTLSAGELQRLRLASQLRTGLFGVTYVLDEPSAGLHVRERQAVIGIVRRLLESGNSVLLVEHDMDLVRQCDWIVDVGPGAGEGGGEILYSGPLEGFVVDTPTRRALDATVSLNDEAPAPEHVLELEGITARTLRGVDVEIPLGQFTAVAGLSGTGKSTLVSEVLPALLDEESELEFEGSVRGAEHVDRTVVITQKPIGRNARSTLSTYTGLFDHVRKLFASTPEAKKRGWTVSRFSYNVKQGQCPTCQGEGQIEVELIFLPGSYTLCPDCHGKRYNEETLEVTWNGYTIADILHLTVDEAREVFAEEPKIDKALRALQAIGLGYLRLGQGAPELSGGEAQRIKLATELQRTSRGHTFYILDEPTTGLHPADTEKLIAELRRLVEKRNTVVVVEHNLAVLAQADRLIQLGEEVTAGTPAESAELFAPVN